MSSSKTLSFFRTVSLISHTFLSLAHFLSPSTDLAFLLLMLHIFGLRLSLCLSFSSSPVCYCVHLVSFLLACTAHAGMDVWVGAGTYWQLPGNRLVHHFIKYSEQSPWQPQIAAVTSLTQRTHPCKEEKQEVLHIRYVCDREIKK